MVGTTESPCSCDLFFDSGAIGSGDVIIMNFCQRVWQKERDSPLSPVQERLRQACISESMVPLDPVDMMLHDHDGTLRQNYIFFIVPFILVV